jgi:hypothetical protein
MSGLGACAPTGDLGRPRPSVVHETIMPAAGAALARQRGEPVSAYPLTDDEQEMRALGWAVVMPPLQEQWRDRALVELRRTRILPASRARLDRASYADTLLRTPYRSSAARYARLKDDVEADTLRVEPFFQAASRVAEGDRARDGVAARLADLRPDESADVNARVEENGLMIAWVRQSFEERLAAYRYALERLMLATPDRASAEVEAALDAFEAVLRSLRPLGPRRGVFKG